MSVRRFYEAHSLQGLTHSQLALMLSKRLARSRSFSDAGSGLFTRLTRSNPLYEASSEAPELTTGLIRSEAPHEVCFAWLGVPPVPSPTTPMRLTPTALTPPKLARYKVHSLQGSAPYKATMLHKAQLSTRLHSLQGYEALQRIQIGLVATRLTRVHQKLMLLD